MRHTKFFLYLVKSLDKLKYNGLIELGNRGVFAMLCLDEYKGAMVPMRPPSMPLVSTEERLSALSPSEREHFLESVAYHKDMLVELAKM
jgi:hypothetical protein